jgi:hypothetical protein
MKMYRVYFHIGNAPSPLTQTVFAEDARDACSKVLIPKHNVQCQSVSLLLEYADASAQAISERVVSQHVRS